MTKKTASKNDTVFGEKKSASKSQPAKPQKAALKTSRPTLSDLICAFEHSPAMVTIAGPDCRIKYVNKRVGRLTGYSQKEMLDQIMHPLRALPPPEKKSMLAKLESGRVWKTIYARSQKNGQNYQESATIWAVNNDSGRIAFIVKTAEAVDIQQATETSFNKTAAQYQTILDSIEEGYYEVDLAGNFTLCNQAFCQSIGISRKELLGTNFQKYRSSETIQKLQKLFDRVYKTGRTKTLTDHELINKNGSVAIVDLTVSLLKNKSGRPIGFSGITLDRTQQKAAEKSLLQSEESYRNVLALAPDMICITRLKDGTYLEVNDAFVQSSGFTVEEVIGKSALELGIFYNPEDRQHIIEIVRKEGLVDRREVMFYTKDKRIDYALLSARPINFQGEECLLTVATLITDLKKSEQALRESEAKYRTIIEAMQEGYYEINLKGNFTFCNEALSKIHGYPINELIGMNNRQYSEPEEAKRVFKRFVEVYETGQPAEIIDYKVFKKDGTPLNLEISASLLRDSNGEPIGFYGITREVTERKKIEQALRESERKYRSILENIEEGYFEVDLAGNITFCNDALCKIYGYGYDEFIGMNNREYTSPETAKKMYAVFSKVYQTGQSSPIIDHEVICKDGSIILIETAASLLKDAKGKPIGFHGIVRNRTERKKAELALMESEEKYRLLVENANEGIFITQDNVIKFPNIKMEMLTGFNADELAGMPFSSLIHPREKENIVNRMEKASKPARKEETYSFRMINRLDETLWIELNTVDITWEGRSATLNFLRDISPQKKMEAQFQQAQKMEAIGTLAGGIAHDFNNLLMSVQGNASLVLLDLDPDDPNAEKLRNIERLVKGGAELTKQLLGAAKGGKYEVKPTDLNDLIQKGAKLFGRTRKEIRIQLKLQDNIWPVEVDRSQIDQVLLNLYVNAWQAMADGGDLYIETKNISLDDYYVRPYGVEAGKYVRISVTDTGIGMDTATRKRVFDPFFTTKKLSRGTGLGLSSAYGIIRNHKGIINVYSEPGEGSTFNIYLPISEKKVAKETAATQNIYTGNETVLFVDDEKTISVLGRQLLEKLGYMVFLAESGNEALKIYQQKKDQIDLIILDMIMPGMNGGETFDKLKEINPEVKVLLSSGYSMNGQAKEILDRGCLGFLQKPFNVAELSEKLRQILDNNG